MRNKNENQNRVAGCKPENLQEVKPILKRYEIIKLLMRWIKKCEKLYDEKMTYVIRDRKDGTIEFRFDGTLYEIIEYYFSDGYNIFNLGSEYATLFNNTGWMSEADIGGVQTICKE